MDLNQLKLNELACAKGASSWLTSLPLAEEGYELHKDLFWDLIRLRYGFQLRRVPTKCECGSSFDLQHALSCKKGGFVSLRHNDLRNSIALLLKNVCKDVTTEPLLSPLSFSNMRGQKKDIFLYLANLTNSFEDSPDKFLVLFLRTLKLSENLIPFSLEEKIINNPLNLTLSIPYC